MVSTLLLFPTHFERNHLSQKFIKQAMQAEVQIELCGFGPIVSAVRTTQLVANYCPKRVLLAGIAGSYDAALAIGSAVEFDAVACFGVGAGSGDGFLTASEMGWLHWPAEPEITDVIHLHSGQLPTGRLLLTCCSASATVNEVQLRLKKYTNAVGEDMEGFSVAAACCFAGVPLRIVRGFSNRAGDRNQENWRVQDAMSALEVSILKVLDS